MLNPVLRDIRLRPQSPTKNNLTPPLFIPRSESPPHLSSTNKPNTMAKIGSIIPLIILFIVIAILAAIGFVAYSIAHDVGKQTRQKLERKNVSFSRDGMKVGVKEVSIEQQEDKTQSVLMKVWNHASWSSYDPKLVWGKGTPAAPVTPPTAERRNPFVRQSSGSQQAPVISRHGSSSNNLSRTTSAKGK